MTRVAQTLAMTFNFSLKNVQQGWRTLHAQVSESHSDSF
jgi:hypothetical protein